MKGFDPRSLPSASQAGWSIGFTKNHCGFRIYQYVSSGEESSRTETVVLKARFKSSFKGVSILRGNRGCPKYHLMEWVKRM